ncbi:MAG: response regulator [candidate division Zixibacteria bacterium]|nr:response regulator [candidate division Zixibacteria bacterium]
MKEPDLLIQIPRSENLDLESKPGHWTFAIIMGTIMIAEAAVMLFLHLLHLESGSALVILLDSMILALIVAVPMYLLLIVPLRRSLRAQSRTTRTLQTIMHGTSSSYGLTFCRQVVEELTKALGVPYAILAEVVPDNPNRVQMQVFWEHGKLAPNLCYDLRGTPCETVMSHGKGYYPQRLQELFPQDRDLKTLNAQSYMGVAMYSAKGRPLGLLAILDEKPMVEDDMTQRLLSIFAARAAVELERVAGEAALRTSESLLRATLESTADGILVVDGQGMATQFNSKFLQMWRIPENAVASRNDKQMLEFVLDQLVDPRAFLTRITELYDSSDESLDTLEFKDGRVFERFSCPLIKDGEVAGRLWSFRDVTQRRQAEQTRERLQERLERAERMESLGLLAGGVAHDLNNILGPITGYAELAARSLPEDSKAVIRLKRISRSAEEAAAVIQDLLTLARRGRYEMAPVNFNLVINSFLESPVFESLTQRYPATKVNIQLSPTAAYILGSDTHLNKAVMNLVANAFEAMPNGGLLTIQTELAHIDKLRGGFQNVKPGNYVILRIRDSGMGIPPEDVGKIFEPYFSRKKMGVSGSGLGLSVVYGVVKDHHGYYDVHTEVGKGTEFELYFPVTGEPQAAAKVAASISRGGTETILVIDDNPNQRELAGEILSSLGYSVRMVENGRRAVEVISHDAVDVIVLDMIMEPDFDGLDTYRAILEIRPHQKAVVVSGFSATDRVQKILELGAAGYVKKPYSIDALGAAVREALERTDAAISG